MLRKWNTPHGTSFFGEVDLKYDTNDGEAIPEIPRLNEKGGKVKISSKLSEKQIEEMELLLEVFIDVLQDKPHRHGRTQHRNWYGKFGASSAIQNTICSVGGNDERSTED